MLSQFVMMPLIAFGLISAMRLNGLYAIGMLVIGCCPGGAVSNIFAYFCDGDVPLSIAMTLCSTVLAMGMMPLNMLLYGQYVDTGDIVIPYSRMATSLVVVSVPAGFGILFNWFFPKISPYITKWGSSLGGLLIVASQIMEVFIFPDLFNGIPPELYGATLLMPLTGMVAGYGASWLCRRPEAVRRTVAIESGIQNVGTALYHRLALVPIRGPEKSLGVSVALRILHELFELFDMRDVPLLQQALLSIQIPRPYRRLQHRPVGGRQERQ
uniref:Putative bile acid transporter n=1 Tax=Ixodes ricinus TaxID=34613 RepID=V5ID64_IXORI